MARSWNKAILNLSDDRPIVFILTLAELSNSATAGLFMSQLLFWWGKGHQRQWVYKTIEEIKKETYLTRSQQDEAIKRWIMLGVLTKKRFGIPPKRHFHIDTDRLTLLVEEAKLDAESSESYC